jgi:hypothetical protein
LSYNTQQVCAHALALAQKTGLLAKYATWHNQNAKPVNMDAFVAHGLSKNTGKKAHKRTQVTDFKHSQQILHSPFFKLKVKILNAIGLR